MENQEAASPSCNLFYRYYTLSSNFPAFRTADADLILWDFVLLRVAGGVCCIILFSGLRFLTHVKRTSLTLELDRNRL